MSRGQFHLVARVPFDEIGILRIGRDQIRHGDFETGAKNSETLRNAATTVWRRCKRTIFLLVCFFFLAS